VFDSTLLPQTNDPQEIQKAVLDLLDKVNQVQSSNSSTSTESIQTFTSNSPVPSTQKYIPVNTDNAITLIISNKYALYDEIEVQRISSGLTANAVTLSFTGETINGASSIALFGNTVAAKTVKYTERFVLRKITSTAWELVAGEDSGANANGSYVKSYNKTLRAMKNVASAFFASGNNAASWTLPSVRIGTGGFGLTGQVIIIPGTSLTYANTITPLSTSNTTTGIINFGSGAAQTMGYIMWLDDFWI